MVLNTDFKILIYKKKCLSKINRYKIKDYIFPSGRKTYVLGYENIMLDILLYEGVDENDITTNNDCPIINWVDNKNIHHKHIPDIYIKSLNKIIEVKSEYTGQINLEHILLKKEYAEKNGYIYEIFVIDKKNKKILYEIKRN